MTPFYFSALCLPIIVKLDMKTYRLTRFLTFGLLLALLALAGCSSRESAVRTGGGATDSILRPDTEVKGARIDLFDRDQKTTEIFAKRIIKFDAKDSTVGFEVTSNFFDSTGKINAVVVGDSALIRESTNRLYIYGHVVVRSEDSTRLDTDYLQWNPDIKKIQTDAFVKVYRRGDVATGWGLEANQTLTRIKILNQVSGTMKDAGSYEDKNSK